MEVYPQETHLSRSQIASDTVARFAGSWPFIGWFSIITFGWMAYNSLFSKAPFDPFPYIFLNLFLTVVSTFQSPLIMMSQNREVERDREAVRGLHAKLDAFDEKIDKVLKALPER